ncbi:MAG: hypothetical protein Q9203_004732 [Teloschistes exilis]
MASLTYDSELMNRQVAAIAVPKSHNFTSANDETSKLMIFSLGTEGVIYLYKEDHTGSQVIINLSSALKVAPAQVKAFDVVQKPSDLTLYITLATMNPGTTGTDLLVLKPFKPTDVDLTSPSLDLSGCIMPRAGAGQTSISAIYMSNLDKGGTYPETVFAYVPIGQVSKASDLASVIVSANFDGWQLANNLHLPEDAFKIIDICPGRLQSGRGFFSLYLIQNELQLMFTTSDQKYRASYKLGCPHGAKCLTTFVDASGYTPLLVGGDSLTYYTAEQCLQGTSGSVISSDKVFAGVQELYVAQTAQELIIFAENAAQGIGYSTTSLANPVQSLFASPLVPDGQGGAFSPAISTNSAALQFVVVNSSGVLSVLQQDQISHISSSRGLFTPNLNKNIDFQACTVHVNLLQADLTAMVHQAVLISSTGWADIIINGRGVSVGPSGVPVLSDESGTVTLIIPTEDVSSYIFTVGNVQGSNIFQNPITWDGCHWITSTAAKIQSWALEDATTGYNLIIQIGDQVFSWLVDGITEIGKSLSWIFDKVLAIAGKIIDWLGFIFNWKDIQNMHKSIVSIVNGGMASGLANLTILANETDRFFLNLENTIKNRAYPTVLTQLVANPAATDHANLDPKKSILHSTKGNYTHYQVNTAFN